MADSTTGNSQRPQQGFGALSQHVSTHKLEMGLWATRLMTILFTFAYFLPIFPTWLAGANPVAAYHKVCIDFKINTDGVFYYLSEWGLNPIPYDFRYDYIFKYKLLGSYE